MTGRVLCLFVLLAGLAASARLPQKTKDEDNKNAILDIENYQNNALNFKSNKVDTLVKHNKNKQQIPQIKNKQINKLYSKYQPGQGWNKLDDTSYGAVKLDKQTAPKINKNSELGAVYQSLRKRDIAVESTTENVPTLVSQSSETAYPEEIAQVGINSEPGPIINQPINLVDTTPDPAVSNTETVTYPHRPTLWLGEATPTLISETAIDNIFEATTIIEATGEPVSENLEQTYTKPVGFLCPDGSYPIYYPWWWWYPGGAYPGGAYPGGANPGGMIPDIPQVFPPYIPDTETVLPDVTKPDEATSPSAAAEGRSDIGEITTVFDAETGLTKTTSSDQLQVEVTLVYHPYYYKPICPGDPIPDFPPIGGGWPSAGGPPIAVPGAPGPGGGGIGVPGGTAGGGGGIDGGPIDYPPVYLPGAPGPEGGGGVGGPGGSAGGGGGPVYMPGAPGPGGGGIGVPGGTAGGGGGGVDGPLLGNGPQESVTPPHCLPTTTVLC